jgi:predicted transcriptional regulator
MTAPQRTSEIITKVKHFQEDISTLDMSYEEIPSFIEASCCLCKKFKICQNTDIPSTFLDPLVKFKPII